MFVGGGGDGGGGGGRESGMIGRGGGAIFWRRTDSKPECTQYRLVPLNFRWNVAI